MQIYHLGIKPGNLIILESIADDTGAKLMTQLYVMLVNDAKAQYAESSRLLTDVAKLPLFSTV